MLLDFLVLFLRDAGPLATREFSTLPLVPPREERGLVPFFSTMSLQGRSHRLNVPSSSAFELSKPATCRYGDTAELLRIYSEPGGLDSYLKGLRG